jgi:hypothetical protein
MGKEIGLVTLRADRAMVHALAERRVDRPRVGFVSERVLGLPGDVRVDKDVPFTDVPTGGR